MVNLENTVNLLDLPIGVESEIVEIDYEGKHRRGSMHHGRRWHGGNHLGRNFYRRMHDLGVYEGIKVKKIRGEFPCNGGPIQIQVDSTVYMLGCGEAENIYVKYKKNETQ